MKDLRDLKDFDDTRCATYRRRTDYRTATVRSVARVILHSGRTGPFLEIGCWESGHPRYHRAPGFDRVTSDDARHMGSTVQVGLWLKGVRERQGASERLFLK